MVSGHFYSNTHTVLGNVVVCFSIGWDFNFICIFSGLLALLLLVALLGISGKMGFVSPTVRAPIICISMIGLLLFASRLFSYLNLLDGFMYVHKCKLGPEWLEPRV